MQGSLFRTEKGHLALVREGRKTTGIVLVLVLAFAVIYTGINFGLGVLLDLITTL